MFWRLLSLIPLLSVLSAPLSAAPHYSDRTSAVRSQFVNRKTVNTPRHDPRLHFLSSNKANSCLAGIGSCTLSQDEGPVVQSRYKNSVREKEAERRRKIRPWL